jgi:hypothetical protein
MNATSTLCQILDLGSGRFTVQPQYPLSGADNVVCRIIASQPGNATYAPAVSVERTLTFKKQATKIVYRTSASTVSELGTYLYSTPTTIEGRIGGSSELSRATSLTPTICIVDNFYLYDTVNPPRATVRAKANGTCSIKIDYPGNGDQLPSTATWTSTISGLNAPSVGANAPQTITFPAIPDREYGFSWKLQATSTSKLPVKYTSLTPVVCQIIEALADGPSVQSSYPLVNADASVCTIQASQAGDDRYAAAPGVQQSFKYKRAGMVITPYAVASSVRNAARTPVASKTYVAKSTYYFASSLLFTSGANSGLLSIGNPMRAASTTPAVCSVASVVPLDNTGGIFQLATVNTLASGTCTVVWNFDGTSDRAATSTNMSFTVK